MSNKKLSETIDNSGIPEAEWSLPADANRLQQLINMIPDAILILNNQRQTLLANEALLRVVGCTNNEQVIGKRPGELFHCLREYNNGECGSTNFCKYCGASAAIDNSYKGTTTCAECNITDINLNISRFRVWSNPIRINKNKCTFFTIRSLDEQLRHQETERKMFANLQNIVSNMAEMISFDHAADITDSQLASIRKITGRMENELINIQDLLDAESGQLQPVITKTDSLTILRESIGFFKDDKIAAGQTMLLQENSESVVFNSDAHLIRRILLNMIRNALEAGQSGDSITGWCGKMDDNIVFSVANHQYITQDMRKHLFEKTSSPEDGGGYGAYIIKLLAEKYLNGKVEYQTSPELGTIFRLFLPDK